MAPPWVGEVARATAADHLGASVGKSPAIPACAAGGSKGGTRNSLVYGSRRPLAALRPAGAISPARGHRGRAAARDRRRARRDGRGCPGRCQPGAGAVCRLRRADRWGAQLAYPAHGDHDDVCCRAGRGLGAAGRGPGPAAGGGRAARDPGRRRADSRRDRPSWPLYTVRLVLSDDRLPDWNRDQHRVRPDRRPDRRSGAGRFPLGQGHRRAQPSRPD